MEDSPHGVTIGCGVVAVRGRQRLAAPPAVGGHNRWVLRSCCGHQIFITVVHTLHMTSKGSDLLSVLCFGQYNLQMWNVFRAAICHQK